MVAISEDLRKLGDFKAENAGITMRLGSIKYAARSGLPFFAEVYGTGFEATVTLSVDDLDDLQDWIDKARAAAGCHQQSEVA